MAEYLAHISKDQREQILIDHLHGTAELCAGFAKSFGAEDQGKLAGMMHDIGKYSKAFQRRLHGGIRVDHSTAGAYECAKKNQACAALCIAGHHAGIPDMGSRGLVEGTTLQARVNRAHEGKIENYDAWQKDIQMPAASVPAKWKEGLPATFFTRMLYSCLVDADYLDTERFMDGTERDQRKLDSNLLNGKLNDYTAGWFPPSGELNEKRCTILRSCIDGGERYQPGLFTLTVPTGGGKTVASLAFALRHAKQYHKERIIYVIPYTSIIEQTADVFRKILGDEQVLEHHSGVIYDDDCEMSAEQYHLIQATENWDMPVIVTTAVQFFESLYSNRSSKCRKLHNIANSVIIFDEAQMMPLDYIKPCVHAISQLVAEYGVSAVLCTATQPALNGIFETYLPAHRPIELCPDEIFKAEIFRRVSFRFSGTLTEQEVAKRMMEHEQVLCIVNSRKRAAELYDLLGPNDAFHLSTLMIPEARREILTEVRRRLKCGEPCRVVSTSLIEAGVDVDFPAVYRELAGLDSILQAAGRCNREGKRNREDSIVTVYRAEGKVPKMFQMQTTAAEHVVERFDRIDSKEAVTAYFTELLGMRGEKAMDKQGILELLEKKLAFETAAKKFHLIDSDSKTVYIPIGEGAALVARLLSGERNRNLFRALGRYGAAVYEEQFNALDAAGVLHVLEDGNAVLTNLSYYDEHMGLSLSPQGGAGLFI